jgi:hypothetical protein
MQPSYFKHQTFVVLIPVLLKLYIVDYHGYGAKPGIKKCKRGNGTIFTANFLKSAFNFKYQVPKIKYFPPLSLLSRELNMLTSLIFKT